jgi:hypothetical protein
VVLGVEINNAPALRVQGAPIVPELNVAVEHVGKRRVCAQVEAVGALRGLGLGFSLCRQTSRLRAGRGRGRPARFRV